MCISGWQIIEGINKGHCSDDYKNLLKIKKDSIVNYNELRSRYFKRFENTLYRSSRLIQLLEKKV